MNFKGTVVHGRKREGTLPSLNLDVQPELDQGVYAVWVIWKEQKLPGAMNWGPQPTFDSQDPVVEIHLLEGEGDWYGREVEVESVEWVRAIQKFVTKGELLDQIQQDLLVIKKALSL